ncbi:MAG: superoxide dismutase [Lachnospiraceae bacterium]|nr:superoxide dismutase [Lachnospiraceae bacterium]
MFEQIKLDYGFEALEPYIDAETMATHYGKHHAAYTANLNKLAEKSGKMNESIEDILAEVVEVEDIDLRTGLRNNAGGYYNHNLYFRQITPGGSDKPSGALANKIEETFGSFDLMKEKLTALAMGQFGSGWAWLSKTQDGSLYASKTDNQDNPVSLHTGHTPIMCIDVWEHAYYLKYKNLRASYIEELWKIINWDIVGELYESK